MPRSQPAPPLDAAEWRAYLALLPSVPDEALLACCRLGPKRERHLLLVQGGRLWEALSAAAAAAAAAAAPQQLRLPSPLRFTARLTKRLQHQGAPHFEGVFKFSLYFLAFRTAAAAEALPPAPTVRALLSAAGGSSSGSGGANEGVAPAPPPQQPPLPQQQPPPPPQQQQQQKEQGGAEAMEAEPSEREQEPDCSSGWSSSAATSDGSTGRSDTSSGWRGSGDGDGGDDDDDDVSSGGGARDQRASPPGPPQAGGAWGAYLSLLARVPDDELLACCHVQSRVQTGPVQCRLAVGCQALRGALVAAAAAAAAAAPGGAALDLRRLKFAPWLTCELEARGARRFQGVVKTSVAGVAVAGLTYFAFEWGAYALPSPSAARALLSAGAQGGGGGGGGAAVEDAAAASTPASQGGADGMVTLESVRPLDQSGWEAYLDLLARVTDEGLLACCGLSFKGSERQLLMVHGDGLRQALAAAAAAAPPPPPLWLAPRVGFVARLAQRLLGAPSFVGRVRAGCPDLPGVSSGSFFLAFRCAAADAAAAALPPAAAVRALLSDGAAAVPAAPPGFIWRVVRSRLPHACKLACGCLPAPLEQLEGPLSLARRTSHHALTQHRSGTW